MQMNVASGACNFPYLYSNFKAKITSPAKSRGMATACPRQNAFPATRPKFFKIIWDPQADSLRIPAVFRRRYGQDLSKSAFLKVPSGSSFEVELVQSNGETWLQKGWQEFIERYSVGFGHLLVFQYNGNSHFDVLIFDTTASEIEYPFDTNYDAGMDCKRATNQIPNIVGNGTESNEQESNDSVVFLEEIVMNKNGVGTGETQEVSDGTESDDSVVFLGETVTNKKVKDKGEDQEEVDRTENDVCVEILNSNLPRQQNRRKRQHCADMIGFSDDYPLGKSVGGIFNASSCFKDESGSKFSYPSHHFGRAPNSRVKLDESNSGLDFQSLKSKLKKECSDGTGRQCSDTLQMQKVVAKETCIAYQKALSFKSNHHSQNPFCICLLQQSYVSNRFSLNVPLSFARGNLPRNVNCSLTLRTGNGKDWSVRCIMGKNYAKLSSGWKDFAVDNGLKVGDACIFEAANSTSNLVWNVVIFRG